MEPEVSSVKQVLEPVLHLKPVHFDSIGQPPSCRSDPYLIRAIHDLPALIKNHWQYCDDLVKETLQKGRELEEMRQLLQNLPKTNPNRNKIRAKIEAFESLIKAEGLLDRECQRRTKILGDLQTDLQLYISEAQKRGILSASELNLALDAAGLSAAAARLLSSSSPLTSSVPAPSAPTGSQEVIYISSDEEQ